MSPLLSIALFLLSTHTVPIYSVDNTSENFFQLCPPTRCGNSGPSIRYPFRLNNTQLPSFCGREGYELSCSGTQTSNNNNPVPVLHLPFSGDFLVSEIYYPDNWISLTQINNTTNCPIQTLLSLNRSGSILEEPKENIAIAKCSERVQTEGIFGPIGCLSDVGDDDNSSLVYVMDASDRMDKLPSYCNMFKYARFARVVVDGDAESPVERLLRTGEMRESFAADYQCLVCERSGHFCGFNGTTNQTICSPTPKFKSRNAQIFIGTMVGGGGSILLALVIFIIYRRRKKSASEKQTELKIEKFLENYKTLVPTRYTFTDVKTITSRFKKRLGQGGYGRVYQGKLPNGIPVAVKVLENSKGNGVDFMNEVATISRLHHFNVVRLVGFCCEGSWRSLVYEFMPKGSLDKFIVLSKEGQRRSRNRCPLSWEKLQHIATGVAHGIEYLHQGCNQRILHFDIKPHNILLDRNFHPKISDFGLAKLCAKDQSVVSMTAARGTSGYIAPELFSRNFGEVSYKSDVYSFGMLLLEMVGCRKNTDIFSSENQSEVYFPEWIYDRLMREDGEQELGLEVEVEGDEEIGKKIAMVGLWCIQWSPTNRPSMTRVVQMLEGDLASLEMPPKPFLSSDVKMGLRDEFDSASTQANSQGKC